MIIYNEDKKSLIVPNGLGVYTDGTMLMPIVKVTQPEYDRLVEEGRILNNHIYIIIDL